MLIPKEKLQEAKAKYDGEAITEICDYFGITFNEKTKSALCPFHEDKNPSFSWNPKSNQFHCFGCSKNFDIIDLYLLQGLTYVQAVQKLFEKTGIEFNFTERGIQSKQAYRYPKREFGYDKTLVEDYLKSRKISKETLEYADIQEDQYGNIVFHYYDTNDVLLNVKYRPSRKINSGESKMWFQKDADTTPILFNMNRIDPTKPLVVTEGEIDALSIIEAGYKNVVSVPTGAQSYNWIEECWDWLEQFDKIIVWSDNDEPGIKMRNECIRRLGSARTMFIDIKEEHIGKDNKKCKDANELLYFYGKDILLEYINNPIETPVQNVLDLFSVDDIDYETLPGLYTHIRELDEKIGKVFYSQLVILTGKTGEGKSSFASSVFLAQALEQYESCYVYSGELSPSNVKNWLCTALLGRENIEMKNSVVRVFNKEKYAKLKEWAKERVFIHDNNKGINESDILKSMEETARKKGARVFLIDNLMCLNLDCNDGDELKAQTSFINKLVHFAQKFESLVILVSHPRKGAAGMIRIGKDDIAGSSNILNLTHMAISVRRLTKDEKKGIKNGRGEYISKPIDGDVEIDVLKNRINGQCPRIYMKFDPVSMRFYTDIESLWHRFKFDDNKSPLPNYDPNKKEEVSPL